MATFNLLIQASPQSPINSHALAFAHTVLRQGHSIYRLFFYGDGVYTAAECRIAPQGEYDIGSAWQTFIQTHRLDAVVCIAAALRRGIIDAEEAKRYQKVGNLLRPGFALSGLGQLIESSACSDRTITFG